METLYRVELRLRANLDEALKADLGVGTGRTGAPARPDVPLGEMDDVPLRLRLAQIELRSAEGPAEARLRLGKIEPLFVHPSDLVWDADVRPEGAAFDVRRRREAWELLGAGGVFILESARGERARMSQSIQAVVRHLWPDRSWLGVGTGVHHFERNPDQAATEIDLLPVEAFAAGLWQLYIPVRAVVHGAVNPRAPGDPGAWLLGVGVGRTAAVYGMELGAQWRRAERYSVPQRFAGSEYGAGVGREEARWQWRYRAHRHAEIALTASRSRALDADDSWGWRWAIDVEVAW